MELFNFEDFGGPHHKPVLLVDILGLILVHQARVLRKPITFQSFLDKLNFVATIEFEIDFVF